MSPQYTIAPSAPCIVKRARRESCDRALVLVAIMETLTDAPQFVKAGTSSRASRRTN